MQATPSSPPPRPPELGLPALGDYAPASTLRLPRTEVLRPASAVIDFHAHLGRWLEPEADWVAADLNARPDLGDRRERRWAVEPEAYLELMDRYRIELTVNLDGGWGAELEANLDRYDRAWPGRFATFCQLDFGLFARFEDAGPRLVESLERSAAAGARGLKIWKTLGLGFRDRAGELLAPDDRRLDEIFAAAGRLGLIVLIHTADPVAFFDPVDHHNERLEELVAHPEWSFAGPGLPSHAELMRSQLRLVGRHPQTTFVAAHVAGNVEDLGWVGAALDSHPNLHVDLSARVSDLGRQPRAARELFCRYRERILFGSDAIPAEAEAFPPLFRFLESADEAYEYSQQQPPPAGRWTISGLELPAEVLALIYSQNARRLLGEKG